MPVLKDDASQGGDDEDSADEDEYDDYGNKIADGGHGDSQDESVGGKRQFDLTALLGESVNQQVPEQLKQLVLTSGQLAAKSKNWRAMSRKRFSERRKHGYVESQKELLPPEVLR